MERLLELLKEVKEDVDFENEEALIDDHILDSFDILQIISTLNDEYDISIPATEIIPKNFNSAKAMLEMVERLQDE
ncbi:MAG: acyl carrier protein [Lachnospiraceae bacterium]|nr:acyl carrier protein [Lachnospiraceae bacterium]MBQ9503728.1 acyl carrier protein [Lachnospiraceae bacterium]